MSGEALRFRVLREEGVICADRTNKSSELSGTDKYRPDTIAIKWTGDQESYTPGKYIQSARVERLFEVNIPAETIKTRARRIQGNIGSNEPKKSESETKSDTYENDIPKLTDHKGGAREGAGRPRLEKMAQGVPQPEIIPEGYQNRVKA